MPRPIPIRDVIALLAGLVAIAGVTALLHALSEVNPTTVALAFLLVVLGTATFARLRVAIVVSIAAMLTLNFFFLPADRHVHDRRPAELDRPVCVPRRRGDRQQSVGGGAGRAREAIARRNEVTRLFDLTRDVLLTTETAGAVEALARHVARRFEFAGSRSAFPPIRLANLTRAEARTWASTSRR